jgi:CRISPR-associated protein Cmr6
MRYPLPSDTAAVPHDPKHQSRNLGLVLDRFQPINDHLDHGKPWADPADEWKVTDEAKRRQRAPVSMGPPVPTLLKHLNARRAALLKSFQNSGYVAEELTKAPEHRLVVGLGAEHVLETSLSLHRVYGIPIIPGSAVKGLTHAAAFWDLADQLGVPPLPLPEREQRQKAGVPTPLQLLDRLLGLDRLKDRQAVLQQVQADPACRAATPLLALDANRWSALSVPWCAVFGTTGRKGQVLFLDAYPKDRLALEVDVLNPHYGAYYRAHATPPADYLSPVPTYFLTVAKGSTFHFILAGRDAGLVGRAKSWLMRGLTELGLGGKTAAGYGFFQP